MATKVTLTSLKRENRELREQSEQTTEVLQQLQNGIVQAENYLRVLLSLVDQDGAPTKKTALGLKSWKDVQTHIKALIDFAKAQAEERAKLQEENQPNEEPDPGVVQPATLQS